VTDTSPGYALMHDKAMLSRTKAALSDTTLILNDIEFVKIEAKTDVSSLLPFLDIGADLGAREVICAPYDPNLSRLANTLGALSDAANERGLSVSLEFFPWTVVPDIVCAHELVKLAGSNVGLLVDALHFDRSNSKIDDLLKVESDRLRMAHLCDAKSFSDYSIEQFLHTARAERMPPGEGQIDLKSLIAALPNNIPIGVEVPMNYETAKNGSAAVLTRIMSATQKILRSAELG